MTVTVIYRRRVRAGREPDYERWLTELLQASRGAPGYAGVETIRPGHGAIREYASIVRFDSYANLQAWECSGVRDACLARLAPDVVDGAVEIQRLEGLEFWFQAPGAAAVTPSRQKMVAVMIPLTFAVAFMNTRLIRAVLGGAPPVAQIGAGVTLQVMLMTYLIMPRVTRWLRRWLFAPQANLAGSGAARDHHR